MQMDPTVEITDDEQTVDQKTKDQILTLRETLDQDERNLYVERMSDPQFDLSPMEADRYWGIPVRQYLRGIKRLWSDDLEGNKEYPLPNVKTYWEDIVIGRETLVPPDTADRQFSLMAQHEEYDERQLRRVLDLPRTADLPMPQTFEFKGLSSILNTNKVSHTWVVKTDDRGPPPQHTSIRLQSSVPVPKHVLENAIEAADNFLQQAGVGFDIQAPDYMGGQEPGI